MYGLWKLRGILIAVMLLASTLFVFTTSVEAAPGGNVTISNVSPANESIAIAIVGNPPEDTGYVNLSFTLTDGNGGNDMEFYINVSVGGTWFNRIHQTGQSTGSWSQHETGFSHTNTTYYWNVSYRDGVEPFKTELYHFRTEARPDAPDTPTPTNGTMVLKGDVTLKCMVHHPDGGLAPVMNVTFYEWPSGRVIGYDNSSYGDGDTATCDTSYNCFYNGTKYYWYAVAHDDEFDSDNSSIWHVQTYYNDSEPSTLWYTTGGDIWVEPVYTDTEPSAAWYTLGGVAHIYSNATFNNPIPADDAIDQWTSLILSLDVNTTTPKYTNFNMRPNAAGAYDVNLNISGAATNWECVDEVTPDNLTTYVYEDNDSVYGMDSYSLPNHTFAQHGDQLNVTIHYRIRNNTAIGATSPGTAVAKIRTHDTNYSLAGKTLTDSWVDYNYMWDLNPNTGLEWTWAEIDALEAGIEMVTGYCTQLYINVYYRQSLTKLTTQFYTNDTVSGNWSQIGADIPEQRTNYTATMPFSGLQFSKDYWWRVRVYNTTVEQDQNSSIYHFTTIDPPPEPTTNWYSLGGDIWVEPSYTDTEPDAVWYTLGGVVEVYHMIGFTNNSPANGATGLWRNTVLSIWTYKSGDSINYNFTFYTNDTVSGNWSQIGAIQSYDIPANRTLSMPFSGLEYNRTYYWKVNGTAFGDARESGIYWFKTNYTIMEPDAAWFSIGGGIWVEPPYTDTEPGTMWYTLGGNITIGAPYKPINPSPADGLQRGKHIIPDFSCYVEDPQNYRMNVSFYWGNDTLIGTDTYVDSGTRASIPVGWLTNYTWHTWYAVANNSCDSSPGLDAQSDNWLYRPGNIEPSVNLTPEEGDTNTAVRRKLVGGVYQNFVRLIWVIGDVEEDIMAFNCYVDNPAIGNWDDWISRWSIFDAVNNTYYQDEILFDTPVTAYTWRLYLADDYNTTENYMNFTTSYYFWANFNFTPYRASNDDNVLLIDESQNATDYWWYVNEVLIANASGLNASDRFNTTHKFNISNVYNITQVVYNESEQITDSMTRYIYIDRNLTLNRSVASAIVYYGHSPRGDMTASALCSLLDITSDAWVHMYNTTSGQWESYWLVFPAITTDFNILLWDALAFALGTDYTKRINITDASPDQRESFFSQTAALENMTNSSQSLSLPAGRNYICWSNVTSTTSFNLSIGFDTNDWVYFYNTSSGTWSTFRFGVGGTDFTIDSYTILILNLAGARTITMQDGF